MKIMAVNAGSSSLKFQLLEMPSEHVITSGVVERIGFTDAKIQFKFDGKKQESILPVLNHGVAVSHVLKGLIDFGIISSLEDITGVGHRVVQGGEFFQDSVLITDEVIEKVLALTDLAPLHNPANVTGIKAFQEAMPNVPHVAVFDTTFHTTMAKEAYMYATPYEWYEKYGVRKYGFHGTSHKYVSERTADILGKPLSETKIIICHIGNGASVAAVKGGKSIDTSMGLTPLEGIPMGTRTGNVDPTIIELIAQKEGKTLREVLDIFNKKSGYLGVSQLSSDARDLEDGMDAGNEKCVLAFDIQAKRILDYIGSYYFYMGGLDALVFTAGIGENSWYLRELLIKRLAFLGAELNPEANRVRGKEIEITSANSKLRSFVIPTNEEVMIARDVIRLTK